MLRKIIFCSVAAMCISCSSKVRWHSVSEKNTIIEISENSVHIEIEDLDYEGVVLVVKNFNIIKKKPLNKTLTQYVLKDIDSKDYIILYQSFDSDSICYMNSVELLGPTYPDTIVMNKIINQREKENNYPAPQYKFSKSRK